MTRRVMFGLLFILIGCTSIISVSSATQLEIRFQDADGKPVTISRAELLLVAWGAADRQELVTDGDLLRLNLGPSWLQSRWPDRFWDMEKAYINVQAAGYASIRSEPFLWLGSHGAGPQGQPLGERVAETKIDFRQGKSVTVREGDNAQLTVILRKPEQRILRFLDSSGSPAANLKVDVKMFWSEWNHCGALAGADPLLSGVTDAEGDLSVPDGDFPYVFIIENRRVVFVEPEGEDYPHRKIMYLRNRETILRVHYFTKRPLFIDVVGDQGPLPGAILFANLSGCPCGACYGVFATSDTHGQVRVDDFYPEEFDKIWLCVNERMVWSADPEKLPGKVTKVQILSEKTSAAAVNVWCK